MKKIIFTVFIILTITDCSNVKQNKIKTNDFEVQKTIQSQLPKIDAYVNYYGTVPCNDSCIAIETNIYLTNFQTFVQRERYLYKDYQTLKITHGTFSVDDEDHSLINLSNGITYKIHDKNNLQKFKSYGQINEEPTFDQKQNAKKIYNVNIDYNLQKIP